MASDFRFPTLLAACFCAAVSFAQTVNVNYLNPVAFSVCENGGFEVTVSNTLTETIHNVKLSADLPGGLNYVPGSVANASQSNIANMNAPVFSLPDLPPGTLHVLTFQAAATCELIAAINGGQLFENVYAVTYDGGSKTVTTLPYVVETALLQVFSLDSPAMSGLPGEVLTRTWKIVNTRLGTLSQLVFSDTFSGDIQISVAQGVPLASSPGYVEVQLGAADFANFGDGDGLFELNEVIEIVEVITLDGCGGQANSILRASWGCGVPTQASECQVVEQTATIQILPSNQNPVLVASVVPGVPTDFCAGESVPQMLKLTNTGTLPANDVVVLVRHSTGGVIGLEAGSLGVKVGGVPTVVTPIFSTPVQFLTCSQPGVLYESAELILPTIPAGVSVEITWDAYVCAVDCQSSNPGWKHYFYYEKHCPPNLIQIDSGSTAGIQVPNLLKQFVSFYIGELLENGETYLLNYTLKSPFLVDSVGQLKIQMDLPCGLVWGDNAGFQLAGQSPDSVLVSAPVAGTPAQVTLFFDLPFGVDSVASPFFLDFYCLEDCFEFPPCVTKRVSSCTFSPLGGHHVICTGGSCNVDAEGLIDVLPVNVNSTILLDGSECGPRSCENFGLWYDCTSAVDSTCYDTILGYFKLAPMDFHRENLGSPDNDNNRKEDVGGVIQPNLIRQDRAITGDTLETLLGGSVVIDVPGATLPEALFTLTFSSHSADIGWDGGLMLDTVQNYKLLLHEEGIVNLGGKITIYDAESGQVFKCDLPTPGALDTLKGQRQVVNTRPAHVLDRWWQMNFSYLVSPAVLASAGCPIPADWVFEAGDSVEIRVRHRVLYNPLKNGSPYTINLRTSSQMFARNQQGAWQNKWYACAGWAKPWQLSGYKYLVTPGSYDLPPCADSDSPDNTFFHLFLSQGNFFPYEFRHLAHLLDWRYETPPGLTLLKTDLIFLQLQGGANLLTNLPVPSIFTGDGYELQLANFQNPKTDEGFSFWLRHRWELDCSIASLKTPITVSAWLAPSLPEPSPATLEFDGGGFIKPLRPQLLLVPAWTHFVGLSDVAAWEFELKNAAAGSVPPAANAWISVSSATGGLDEFQLENLATGQVWQPTGGLFQLGELPSGFLADLRLTAKNHSCLPDTVTLQFGWNCDPFTNLADAACWRDTLILTVEPQLGELEMDVASPDSTFQLCDTIGWHVVEIFNAKLGSVYDLTLEAAVPPGLLILPGTCEIAYPTGSTFVPVADPVELGNGLMQWDLSQLVAALGTSGLPGFNQPPNHSVSLRFRSATACGFISGSQIIFTSKAQQLCDIPTNILSKPGEPLQVEGVAALYSTAVSVETDPVAAACGENLQLEITLESDGETAPTDSVFVILPAGWSYVSGSYQPLQNASPGEPATSISNGNAQLKWALQAGVEPGEPIRFRLTLELVPGINCDTGIVKIVSYQTQEAVCLATGQLCSVLAETGSAEVTVVPNLPVLTMSNLMIQGENGTYNFSMTVENAGADAVNPLTFRFFHDVDNSGNVNSGDVFLNAVTFNGGIPGGGSVTVEGELSASYEQLCQIVAGMFALENCLCDAEFLPGQISVLNVLPPAWGCSQTELEIGVPGTPGHVYQWQAPDHVECQSCPTTTFQTWELGIPSGSQQTINLTLFDDNQAGCVVENMLTLTLGGATLAADNELTVCENVPFTLFGEPGVSWQWSGNGVPNLNQQSQVLSFSDFTLVQVNSLDSFGCVSSVNYEVSVVEPFEFDTVLLCPGGSVVVDSVEYFTPAQVCDTTITWFDCELVHCTQILQVDSPQVDFPTTTILTTENQDVILDFLPETFAAYAWSPANLLSCATCPAPTAPPLDTTYLVTVTDANGCSTSGSAQVRIVPKCSVFSVALPNIFTPNGDGVNDHFKLALQEGVENVIVASRLRIYDRWGELVFEGDAATGWDGQRNGRAMASDVFVWILEVECVDEKLNKSGDVTLAR